MVRLMDQNPICGSFPLTILSCRDEFLTACGIESPHLVMTTDSTRCRTMHVQPFTQEDDLCFLQRNHCSSASRAQSLFKRIRSLVVPQSVRMRPLTLDMVATVLLQKGESEADQELDSEYTIYEQYTNFAMTVMTKGETNQVDMRTFLEQAALLMLETEQWVLPLSEVLQCALYVDEITSCLTRDTMLGRVGNPSDDCATFSFRHKSFAEYFAACALLRNPERKEALKEVEPAMMSGLCRFLAASVRKGNLQKIVAEVSQLTLHTPWDLTRIITKKKEYTTTDSAKLYAHLGNACGDFGDMRTMKELLEVALKIQQEANTPEFDIAKTLCDLGIAFGALGEIHKMKDCLEQGLTIKKSIYGPNHIEVARTLCDLATAHRALDEDLLEEALQIKKKMYRSNIEYMYMAKREQAERALTFRVIQDSDLETFRTEIDSRNIGTCLCQRQTDGKMLVKKLLSSEQGRDIQGKLQSLLSLRHRNIVSIVGVMYSPDDTALSIPAALFTEYVDGGSARQRIIERHEVPTPPDFICIALDVISGLKYLHSRGIVHGNIKPENILLGDGGAQLCDSGLLPRETKYKSGDGPKADIYALGYTLLEIAMGRCLTQQEVTKAKPPQLCEELVYMLHLCVQKTEPERRMSHVGHLERVFKSKRDK